MLAGVTKMSFVKFTQVGKHFQPRAIISACGVISLNEGACKKFNLRHWTHCVMYLDPDAHTIGLELVNDENIHGANKLRRIRPDWVDINASSFLEHFKLRVRRPLSFRLSCDLETEWLTIRLDDAEVVESEDDVQVEEEMVQPTPARNDQRSGVNNSPSKPGSEPSVKPAVVVANNRNGPQNVSVTPVVVSVKPTPSDDHQRNGKSPENSPSLVANASAANRARGVKAMISELLQD